MSPGPRSRALLLPLMVLTVALGLGSRSAAARLHLPRFVTDYAGDALWTVMVYLCLVFVLPRLSIRLAAAGALGISVLVELSQLLHTPWLDALRAHRLGALILGRGFLVSDLFCYAGGAGLAAGLEWLRSRRRAVHRPAEPGAPS